MENEVSILRSLYFQLQNGYFSFIFFTQQFNCTHIIKTSHFLNIFITHREINDKMSKFCDWTLTPHYSSVK